jgi:hypothetical protein
MSSSSSQSSSSGPQPVWTKEIRYENPASVGHVIGYGGCNVRRWQTEYDCRIIIDDALRRLIILGPDEISVLKTMTEVQERMLVSLKYIDKETKQNDADKDEYIDGINTILREQTAEIDELKTQSFEKDVTIYKLSQPLVNDPPVSKAYRYNPGWGSVGEWMGTDPW